MTLFVLVIAHRLHIDPAPRFRLYVQEEVRERLMDHLTTCGFHSSSFSADDIKFMAESAHVEEVAT